MLLLSQFSFLTSSVYAASSPWTQTDWSGGSGQASWSNATKFDSSTGVTTSTAGQVTLINTEELSNTGFEADMSGWNATSASLSNNLISYWNLDEASGTRVDATGNLNDLSPHLEIREGR